MKREQFGFMRINRDKIDYFVLTNAKLENAGRADRWIPTRHAPDVLIDGSEEQTVTHEVIPRTEAA